MTIAIALVLMALALAYIGYPLLRARAGVGGEESMENEELRELISRRDATYTAIAELEFDFEIGNLSRQDHQDLEERYKMKAASLLKDIDTWEKERPLDEEIERQVLRLRKPKAPVAEGLACPSCGNAYAPGDRFCPQCGAKLPGEGEK